MPHELKKAHDENDIFIKNIYKFDSMGEAEILKNLFDMYENLVDKNA